MPNSAAFSDFGGVTVKIAPSQAPNPADPNQLIPAIRRQAVSVFGPGINIPEALPDFLGKDPTLETNQLFGGGDLAYPMLIILAGKPSYTSGYAVQDHVTTTQIDLIYVQQEQPGQDNPQQIRELMEPLIMLLMSDHRQYAGTDVSACNDTRLVATPLDRQNIYMTAFRNLGAKAECGVVSIECDQIRNRFY